MVSTSVKRNTVLTVVLFGVPVFAAHLNKHRVAGVYIPVLRPSLNWLDDRGYSQPW